MELSASQQMTVFTVYLSALLPLVVVVVLQLLGRLPRWVLALYLAGFAVCALGWEIWLTYGLVDGLDVNSRRPEALNAAIPQSVNWVLNSLADAGSIGIVGVFLVWLCYGRSNRALMHWHWGAFWILFVWFVGQNLYVEMFVYQTQLAEGLRLSWAPLIPTGPWYNPMLFEVAGRSVQLQTQLPWILMTPLYYWMLLRIYQRFALRP